MGVRGAATATLSARMIELACCILISSRPGYIRPYLTRLFQRNRELARDSGNAQCRFSVRPCSGESDLLRILLLWDIWE